MALRVLGTSLRPRERRALATGLASGVLLGLASLPITLGPLAFVALVPVLAGIDRGMRPGCAALAGFVAGCLYFGIGFGFVCFASVGAVTPSLFFLLYVPGVALLLSGLFAGLAALRSVHRWAFLLAAPGSWVAFEWLRSKGPIGIPWLELAYALSDWPVLVQSADWVGFYGVSFWVAALNAGLVAMRGMPLRRAGALAALLALPLLRAPLARAPGASGPTLEVAAIQPALAESRRHVPDHFDANLRRLLALSESALAAHPDLLVWPESAWERLLSRGDDAFLAAVANHLGVPLLTGAWRRSRPELPWLRNSAVLAEPGGDVAVVADKVYPVPVYERAPESTLGRLLRRHRLWSGRFEPGEPSTVAVVRGSDGSEIPVAVLVCVDTSYPSLARELRLRGARLFVEVSNEAGTGRWSAWLHSRVSRLRAVETRTPLVRVANTGPSQWFDDRGRIVASLPEGKPRSGVHALVAAGPAPPAVVLGDAPALLAVLGSAASTACVSLRASRRSRRRTRQRLDPFIKGEISCSVHGLED